MLHVGVGGLETAEWIPLDEGWGRKPIPASWGTHDLEGKEKRRENILRTAMTNNGTGSGKFTLALCSHTPLTPFLMRNSKELVQNLVGLFSFRVFCF